jgi:uncharacterized protein
MGADPNPRPSSSWLQTASGRRLCLLNPKPDQVCIEDVAQGLSNIPRWGGRCRFFSVAQHSVFVSRLCEPPFALEALLHDAHEAYIGDLPTPLKRLLGESWERIESRVRDVVRLRFGVPRVQHELVTYADQLALLLEAREFYPRDWAEFSATKSAPRLVRELASRTRPTQITAALPPMNPDAARAQFLARWHELTASRSLTHNQRERSQV